MLVLFSRLSGRRWSALVVGAIVGIAASAAFAGSLVGAIGGSHPPRRPAGEVKVGTPTAPNPAMSYRLTASGIGNGLDVGRIRVLPAGSVPDYGWYGHADKAAGENESPPLPVASADFVKLGVSLHRLPELPGFKVQEHLASVIIPRNGPARLYSEGITLRSASYWPITIEIYRVKDNQHAQVVATEGGGSFEDSVYDASGIPAVIEHGSESSKLQPVLRAHVVVGGFYFVINAGPLPIDILTTFIDQLVAENPS